jgi:hypothetical protein
MWSGVSCGACYSVPPELPLSLFSTCWWGRAAVCKIGNEGARRTELHYYTTYGQHARILQARNSAPLLITSAPPALAAPQRAFGRRLMLGVLLIDSVERIPWSAGTICATTGAAERSAVPSGCSSSTNSAAPLQPRRTSANSGETCTRPGAELCSIACTTSMLAPNSW